MKKLTNAEAKAAALRAADWLEANPDRHVRGLLAATQKGYEVKPLDREAECFCALGRLAKEADIDAGGSDSYLPFTEQLPGFDNIGLLSIYGPNDSGDTWTELKGVTPHCPYLSLSGPDGVKALRRYANNL
ncbi:MAG: hypothetical protein ACTHJR_12325 [Sphingomonas sp.]|uniref:hypothetical protein n=1 Tax=Sphingomonas sp. TaxID=28214 RepID=UPI003F7EA20C